MGRKRTMNYRDFRTDFTEGEGAEPKETDEEEEDEEEDDEEEASDEEGEGDDEAEADEGGGEDDEEAPPKKPKKKKKEPVAKPVRVKKPRASKVVRLRVVWGVFDNANKRIEVYDFNKKPAAEEHAARLMTEKKQTYFVQPVKLPLEEKPA